MFSEILNIKPRLSTSDLNSMERSLSSRFTKVAKGFGKGLKIASVAALGSAVLSSLLNPLQEVKAAIDRTLNKADDIVTNAKQFGTTTENLLRVRSLGQLNGLQPEQIDLLLTKFQGAVAQSRLDPTDESVSAVRNFTSSQDTAEGFFNFIQSLQTLTKDQQVLAQAQIFGEKQTLKMAEFLQANFAESAMELAKVDFAKVAKATEKLGDLQGVDARNKTLLGLRDLQAKAGVIGSGTVANVNRAEIQALNRENRQIGRSGAAFTVEENMNQIKEQLETLVNKIVVELPILMTAMASVVSLLKEAVDGWKMIIDLLKNSSLVRGVKGWFGGNSGKGE